jgi:hypothetical protein
MRKAAKLFDDLVGVGERRRRSGEAGHPCHLEIDEGMVFAMTIADTIGLLQKVTFTMIIRAVLISLCLTTTVQAQKLVDPTKVAPEFREAAEKRRAEQIRQQDCAKKAESEKVMLRERTAFINHCLDTAGGK